MSVLPTSFADQLEYDMAHGIVCSGCQSEYFSVTHGVPTYCQTCWNLADPEDREAYLRADRAVHQSVLIAKKRNAKPPTNENA